IIEIARVIRVGFLQQNAFHKDDTYVPLIKQYKMMSTILYLYHTCKDLISANVPISKLIDKGAFDMLLKMKYEVENDHLEKFDAYIKKIDEIAAEVKSV
ncbi:MAG: V-type ATP synthase subunit A, partial [Acutalibacteraceae bacterium]